MEKRKYFNERKKAEFRGKNKFTLDKNLFSDGFKHCYDYFIQNLDLLLLADALEEVTAQRAVNLLLGANRNSAQQTNYMKLQWLQLQPVKSEMVQ